MLYKYKKIFFFFKLLNKLNKFGKKYKIFLYNIMVFYKCDTIIKFLKLNVRSKRLINTLEEEILINLPFFTKKKKNNIYVKKYLVKDKRLKEFLKWIYIILYKQCARSILIKILLVYVELLFFYNYNIFSILKDKINFNFRRKKKNIKITMHSYLGDITDNNN